LTLLLLLKRSFIVLRRLWELSEFPFHPEKLNHYETLFTIGNGYMAMRGTFEEGYPGEIATTLIHGIYNHAAGTLVPDLVNAPNPLPLRLWVDGTPFRLVNQHHTALQPPDGAVLGYRRRLQLDHGVLIREVLFRAASGSIVRVVFERFASLHDVHLLAQRVRITAVDGDPEIRVESRLDTDVTNHEVRHWADIQAEADGVVLALQARTNQSGYVLGMASRLISPYPAEARVEGESPLVGSTFRLRQEESISLDKLTIVYTSRDVEADRVLDTARRHLQASVAAGYGQLHSAHENEWARYWDTSDVQIEGDDYAQFAVRFLMYHLLIAAPRQDERVSIGAKTLSGLGYKGHVFWDTELFIVPPLILTQPQIARNLLMYRYHNLPGARNKARSNGYEGAMYPWESTDTGEETTPQWSDEQEDGSRIRIWTGDTEQHISTDIAYAVLQYWRWAGDDDFMRRYGAEIVLDTAVFWGSRVEARSGRYEISQQIGPDEYHENIDNSVFTNRMVVWHLEQALQLLDWLWSNAPDDAERLTAALSLTPARLERWRDIIQKMYIPFDDERQIHIQFPGFFDMEYIPVQHYQPRAVSVQAILGHKRSIQSQVIKQADVVMLMALLGDELAPQPVLLNNWNTYYPRTDHGSSLSPAVHAWVAARLGLDDMAYEMFEHAAGIDLENNKGNVRDGIHGAASGGLWQALIFGFCGLHLDEHSEPALDPRLPAHWKRVSFTVYYRGEKRRLTVTNPAMVTPMA
jgi:kojibiose phosphorylase